jgi:hypothetical protein
MVGTTPSHPLLQTDLPFTLLASRCLSAITLVILFYLTHLLERNYILLFYTNWGMLFTLVYYALVLISYRFNLVLPLAQKLLQTCWVMQCMITVAFWGIVWPLSVIYMPFYVSAPKHGLFLVLLTVDMKLSKVKLEKKDGFWVMLFTGLYMFGINMPYSLLVEMIYPLLSFDTLLSWVLTIFFFCAIAAFNELACYITQDAKTLKVAKASKDK